MKAIMFQTSDPFKYRKVINITSQPNEEFCLRHGIEYRKIIGIHLGSHPWHASLNRVFILNELARGGYRGWVIYLDADAWVSDINFDVSRYLDDKQKYAAIFTPSGVSSSPWDINNGVMFFNFEHKLARDICAEWEHRVCAMWDQFVVLSDWPKGIDDDQSLLHRVINDDRVTPHCFLESTDLINRHDATFIKQALRSKYLSFEERLADISHQVITSTDLQACEVVNDEGVLALNQIYKSILNRFADPYAMQHYLPILYKLGLSKGGGVIADILKGSEEYWSNQRGVKTDT